MKNIKWEKLSTFKPKGYTCGYCGSSISSEKGFYGHNQATGTKKRTAHITICHTCKKPTFFDYDDNQTPGPKIGKKINYIPDESVEKLFDEAKDCYSISSFTSAVMLCRKLLMNISVSLGAKEGDSFAGYVSYLNDNGYIPPNGKEWVDSIRKLGNSANHKIEFNSNDEAKRIIGFTEMLLRFIYELPGLMKESTED